MRAEGAGHESKVQCQSRSTRQPPLRAEDANRAEPALRAALTHGYKRLSHRAIAASVLRRRNSLRLSQVFGTTRIHRRKDHAKTQRRKEPNRLTLQKSLRLCVFA